MPFMSSDIFKVELEVIRCIQPYSCRTMRLQISSSILMNKKSKYFYETFIVIYYYNTKLKNYKSNFNINHILTIFIML